jgi:hypothetical protein
MGEHNTQCSSIVNNNHFGLITWSPRGEDLHLNFIDHNPPLRRWILQITPFSLITLQYTWNRCILSSENHSIPTLPKLPVRVLTGASLSFRLSPRNTCPSYGSYGFCIQVCFVRGTLVRKIRSFVASREPANKLCGKRGGLASGRERARLQLYAKLHAAQATVLENYTPRRGFDAPES